MYTVSFDQLLHTNVTNNGHIADPEAESAEDWLKEDSKSPEPVEEKSTVWLMYIAPDHS